MSKRLTLIKEDQTAVLRKDKTTFIVEFVIMSLMAGILIFSVVMVMLKGWKDFDPLLKFLFPFVILVPFFMRPRILRAYRAAFAGEELFFDKTRNEFRRGTERLAALSDIVKIRVEFLLSEGPDNASFVIYLRDGKKWTVDDSVDTSAIISCAHELANFLNVSFESN